MSDNLICEKDEIKDLMPYEKCMEFGAGSLTDTELVAAIIKTGTAGKTAKNLAEDILNSAGSKGLPGIIDMSVQELILEMTGLWRMPNGVQAKWMFLCQFI